MYAGNEVFRRGEVVTCYNLRYRKACHGLYSNIPCFLASELSVFSVKEPQAYLRNSWTLLTKEFKVLAFFIGHSDIAENQQSAMQMNGCRHC